MYVLVPDDKTPAGIEYARRYFSRIYRPVAGVWSIESGEFQAGHHLNVIADYSDITASFKGHIYKERIRTSVRNVAAYMSKADRAATKEEGYSRQTGTIGTAANFLRQLNTDAPLIAGAQALHDVHEGYIPPSAPGPEEHGETAKRWLQPVYQAAEAEAEKYHPHATGHLHTADPTAEGEPDPYHPRSTAHLKTNPQSVRQEEAPRRRRWRARDEPPSEKDRTPHATNADNARAWCSLLLGMIRQVDPPGTGPRRWPEPAAPPACTEKTNDSAVPLLDT